MAFDLGPKKGGPRPVMNVTPLVDVVLVLLIIFMVVTPMLVKQFRVTVPELQENEAIPTPPADAPKPVVLTVGPDGAAHINRDVVPDGELVARLERVLAARTDRTIFFQADDDAPYGRALDVLDLARGGGAFTIAVLTEASPSSPDRN